MPTSYNPFTQSWGEPNKSGSGYKNVASEYPGQGFNEYEMWKGNQVPQQTPGFMQPNQDYISPKTTELGALIADFYKSYMAPDFTSYTPEMRAAIDRTIGSELAVNLRNVSDTMRSQGLFGSGAQSALSMDAANRAALAKANALAQMQASTIGQKQLAAGGLTDLWRTAYGTEAGAAQNAANTYLSQAAAMGPGIASGPARSVPNFADMFMSAYGMRDADVQRMMAEYLAGITPEDLFTLIAAKFS